MQTEAAAEPCSRLTSLQLLAWEDGPREVSPGDVVSVSSRSLRRRRNRGLGGLSASLACLTAVAALAAVYLLVRCALYLTNSREDRTAFRTLAGAEERTSNGPGGVCGEVAEAPPAASTAAEDEEGEEPLAKQQLLSQARHYAVELKMAIERSRSMLLRLSADLRAMCIAELLCLCVTELSALFSLLEKGQGEQIQEDMIQFSPKILALRRTLRKKDISNTRNRHIRSLHALFDEVTRVRDTAIDMAERERLMKMKQLGELQDLALSQLKSGLQWLKVALDSPVKSDGRTSKGDAGAPVAPKSEAHAKAFAVIKAIEVTTHTRREQILRDPTFRYLLLEAHKKGCHYGLVSADRFASLTSQPPQTHSEAVEALKATPLGLGEEPWKLERLNEIDAQQATASSSSPNAPLQGDEDSPPKSPSPDRKDLDMLTEDENAQQGPKTEADDQGSVLVPASPSMPATAASIAASGSNEKHASLLATASRKAASLRAAPNSPPEVVPPSPVGRLEASAVSATPYSAALSSVPSSTSQAAWASHSFEVPFHTSPPPESLPRPRPNSLRIGSPAASAYARGVFTLPTRGAAVQAPVASAGSAGWTAPAAQFGAWPAFAAPYPSAAASASPHVDFSRAVSAGWAAPAAQFGAWPAFAAPYPSTAASASPHVDFSRAVSAGWTAPAAQFGAWPAFAAPYPSAAASALPQADFSPAADVSRPPLREPFSSHQHATVNRSAYPALAAGPRPLQIGGAGARTALLESWKPLLQASASQALLASSGRPAEFHSSSESVVQELYGATYHSPLTFGAWGLPGEVPHRPSDGFFPSHEPDTLRPPSPATISAGFHQLEKLFSGRPDGGSNAP
ncbi:hypothetical protein, conserved [Eimeria praecox]|uniref:Uncharacterized protein n=1 Tax=Eimeria praecox TaxID=51316 RepID=U6G8C5_9EIME|nr:hypothetical protein, conserved [Eimeria praecox]